MKQGTTLAAIVLGAKLLIGCHNPFGNPLGYCTKVTEIPIVDDIQADVLMPMYRSQICDRPDGGFDVYRNGRLYISSGDGD
ncbi:hypothetical protein HYU19_01910 [Candidatus Woesearchaeota archaeon]|nr:hypothetical protein [Candidatus Woesearchaeota archaeon]